MLSNCQIKPLQQYAHARNAHARITAAKKRCRINPTPKEDVTMN